MPIKISFFLQVYLFLLSLDRVFSINIDIIIYDLINYLPSILASFILSTIVELFFSICKIKIFSVDIDNGYFLVRTIFRLFFHNICLS